MHRSNADILAIASGCSNIAAQALAFLGEVIAMVATIKAGRTPPAADSSREKKRRRRAKASPDDLVAVAAHMATPAPTVSIPAVDRDYHPSHHMHE